MHEDLRKHLVNLDESIKKPDNPDLPFLVLLRKNEEYSRMKKTLAAVFEKGLTQEHGLILLDYAIEKNDQLLIQSLEREDIHHNLKDIEEKLTSMIENNDIEGSQQLIKLVSPDDDINMHLESTQFGFPLFLYALMYGNSDVAKLVSERGADPSVTDWLGTSALSCAIISNDSDCFKLVSISSKEELFRDNIYGFSPLHYAVRTYERKGDSKILDELCQRFDLNKKQIIQDYKNYPKVRVDQEILVEKLSQYIKLQMSATKLFSIDEAMDETGHVHSKIKSGLCHGLAFVFGLHATKTSENLSQFYKILELINAWDGSEGSLTLPIKATYMGITFHTLGELINQFSNDVLYFFAQNDLSAIDIAPHDRTAQYNFLADGSREIQSVLDISMSKIRQGEFVEILRKVLKPNTLLDITGAAHTISIVCNSNSEIYYYDPNNYYPTRKPIADLEQLAMLIYNTMPVKYSFQSPGANYIGVYHISNIKNENIKEQYPSQEDIVDKFIFSSERINDLYNELELCVLQDSALQMACILNSDKLPPIKSLKFGELVNTALKKNSFQCLTILIKSGLLDPNQLQDLENNTALGNYREILEALDQQKSKKAYQPRFLS